MSSGLKAYVAGYLTACMLGVLVAANERRHLHFLSPTNRRFLFVRRNLVTFSATVAVACFLWQARHPRKPSWI